MLGHRQIATTQRYTHVDIDDLKSNIRKLGYKPAGSDPDRKDATN
jgi:hypothetical protein